MEESCPDVAAILSDIQTMGASLGMGEVHVRNADLALAAMDVGYLGFQRISDHQVSVYAYFRTSSWVFPGERSDLHELLAVLLATFWRSSGVCSSVHADVPHPAIDSPSELYARYLVPVQPYGVLTPRTWPKQRSWVLLLLRSFVEVHRVLWNHSLAEAEYTLEWDSLGEWAKSVSLAVADGFGAANAGVPPEPAGYGRRSGPSWLFWRSPDVSSCLAVSELFQWAGSPKASTQTVVGPTRVLQLDEHITNAFPNELLQHARDILRGLGQRGETKLIVNDSLAAIVIADHCLVLYGDYGSAAGADERRRLLDQRVVVDERLFPRRSVSWDFPLDDDRFEELCCAILDRQDDVTFVRKAGHSRSPDGGRDLVCEVTTPLLPCEHASESEPPVRRRRLVVQCKASAARVGKSALVDVRDTIEFHEASGMLVLAPLGVTEQLGQHLDRLRHKGYWADWWDTTQWRRRLSSVPDLLDRFDDLLSLETAGS